jgi:hypothetical protein
MTHAAYLALAWGGGARLLAAELWWLVRRSRESERLREAADEA